MSDIYGNRASSGQHDGTGCCRVDGTLSGTLASCRTLKPRTAGFLLSAEQNAQIGNRFEQGIFGKARRN
jgi:hypothetical protein